jgi:hypothetical protein
MLLGTTITSEVTAAALPRRPPPRATASAAPAGGGVVKIKMTVCSCSLTSAGTAPRIGAMTRGVGWRWPAVLAIVATSIVVALAPTPAGAHSGAQPIPDAAYYRTSLSDVVPAPAGVSVRVDPAGEWIELANAGPAQVIVLGYTREPYLLVTAGTVEENQLSPTAYINQSLFADSLPSGQDTGAVAPAWKQIGAGGSVRWHDHRIHWMGQARPPAVAADPRHPHPVGTWAVHATAAGTPFEIHGDLRWIGKPDSASGVQAVPEWLLWLVESMVVVIAMLALLVIGQRRRLRTATLRAALDPPTPTRGG